MYVVIIVSTVLIGFGCLTLVWTWWLWWKQQSTSQFLSVTVLYRESPRATAFISKSLTTANIAASLIMPSVFSVPVY